MFVSGSAQLRSQEQEKMAESHVPKVLRIYREEMKPGRGGEHEKVEAGYVRAFQKANWPLHYIAINSLTGPSEAWFLEAHDSFASIEKEETDVEKMPELKAELTSLDAQDGELRTGGRGIIATFQPDLSFKPDSGGPLAQDHFMSVLTLRVKPGQEAGFREAAKIVVEADEKAGMDQPVIVYSVFSGMPSGTYLMFFPLKSLDYYDSRAEHSKAIREAMGQENWDKFQELSSKCIMSTEYALFSMSPRMSYVTEEFAAADPDFWNPKTEEQKAKPAVAEEE
jgi:hypothetical protein